MSIKPIDFQVMIPKTAEISKIQNDQQQKNVVFNEQQTDITRQKFEENINTVHSRDNAQNVKIDSNQEKKKDEKRQKKNQNRAKYGTKGEKEPEEQTSVIDIRL
ncbi:MAG TPA: hypothetical protein PLH43_04570 [Acetivibrio sp.]|uniref:hypothetical protein n=1 Tax=Acetivibrio sp. TaxID=1872092 RepID=UPI002C844165|nr:hypothetical protein [Acetivibrio sp.]HOM02085.1 hypothetical protein [Acetivibrio sp.]